MHKYNEEQIGILYIDFNNKERELISDELGQGVVSDAVFERNTLVQEQLNVVFEYFEKTEVTQVATAQSLDIQSGQGDYDIVVNGTFLAIQPALEGKYVELSELENMNTSKHYWSQGFNDMVTFSGIQYLASGSMAISMSSFTYVTLYNRNLFDENQQKYRSYVQDQVSSFGISAVVGDGDRREMLAAVLEAMAYHSHILVRPAYYEVTLSSRYMQDPQSKEILDLIFDSLYFDFSSTCSNLVPACVIRDHLRPILSGKKIQFLPPLAPGRGPCKGPWTSTTNRWLSLCPDAGYPYVKNAPSVHLPAGAY